jgi:hypothetical protein
MLKSRCLKDAATAGLLVLFIFAVIVSAQSPANNELLKMIPAKSLFCVRVNNFDYTLNQIDQFLAGVSPMPMGVSMMVRMHLANLLGSPQLNGLNTNGSFALFGEAMPGQTTQTNTIPNIFVGILAPISDYKQFIEGNPNCGQADEKGISKITINGAPALLFAKAGNYVLVSWANEYDNLAAMVKEISATNASGLSGTLSAAEVKQTQTEPIWAYGNIQQVSQTFGPIISAKLEEIKKAATSMNANQPGMAPAAIQNILNVEFGILETLMKETKSVSVAINPKPDVLNITKTVSAVPGTDMAKMFTADGVPQQENMLLTYLPDGAVANFGAIINTPFWKMFNNASIDLFASMAGGDISAEKIKEMKNLAAQAADAVAGPATYSIAIEANNKPPFAFKYVIAVKDQKKFNQVIEKAMDLMSSGGIMDFYKGFGLQTSFSVKNNVDNYKGVSIDSATLTMKAVDANSPQTQMITSMYGEGFNYRWGIADGLFVCAVGSNVESTIHELIDQVKAGGQEQMSSEMKAAISLLPEIKKADFFVTINVLRLIKMATAMVPIPILPMEIQTKSNIVVAGNAADGRMVVNIAVPKQHLTEIMATFMAMQQQQPQQQPQTETKSNSIPEQKPKDKGTESASGEFVWDNGFLKKEYNVSQENMDKALKDIFIKCTAVETRVLPGKDGLIQSWGVGDKNNKWRSSGGASWSGVGTIKELDIKDGGVVVDVLKLNKENTITIGFKVSDGDKSSPEKLHKLLSNKLHKYEPN